MPTPVPVLRRPTSPDSARLLTGTDGSLSRVNSPTDLDAAAVSAAVTGWSPVVVVARTGSTNADLSAAARRGTASVGTVLVAGEQGSGRGRFARDWQSPPGTSVSMSVLLRPAVDVRRWPLLPLVTGLGVTDGLRRLGVDARLKWPNDVLVGGLKVCGILAEMVASSDGPSVVVGMGVNVSQLPDELPVPTATSLAVAGSSAGRVDVVVAVLNALAARVRGWDGGEDVLADYLRVCSTIGNRITVMTSPDTWVEGDAVAVSPEGHLVVDVDGQRRTFAAGDVHHLRPARR